MTLLNLTISGTAFILAIALFRAFALRWLPKGTFVALWWAAALRLLLPLTVPSSFSVYTLLESLDAPAAADAPVMVPQVPAAQVIPRVPVRMAPAVPADLPAPPPEPFPVWTALWLTGAVLLALWFLIRYLRWRRRFREALPVENCPGLETWLSLRRRVEVRMTDRITAPLAYGIFRPVILLPKILDLRDEEAVTCVLAHERAHIRRLDGLFKLVLAAALCVHWFNPAVWLLYVLANRDMELRCDEAAVLALGEDSRERYALTLIRLAELRNECVPLCGFSHKSGMEERIRAIMSIKKQSLLACAVALALTLGITTAFATSAKPADKTPETPRSEDLTDRELHAQSSAETAAQWEEVLAPYEPFGLTWTFDDPDLDGNGLTMTWEGHEVRGIYDEGKYAWITEHAGDGTYGPDAVELYTVYENGELTGLRLATEEEQKAFDRDRRLSSDARMTIVLGESVRYDDGHIYFTIPESEEPWSIFIQGRIRMEDGSGMSVRYLEKESEKAEWVPRMTYSFEVADAAYDELTMDVKYGNASYCYPLTPLLPEGKPLTPAPLPEGKADLPADGSLVWPVDGGSVSQAQGTRANPGTGETETHSGVDIAVERGTPVYAAGPGTVKEAGYSAQDGNFVRLDHTRGEETLYAHCQSLLVKTGDTVEAGQTIATVGSTGRSTGPHLHFEYQVNGVSVDPLRYKRENHFRCALNLADASIGEWTAGSPIVALLDGTVLEAGVRERGYALGPYMEIEYEGGYSMGFKSCQSVLVKTGDAVKAGEILGYTGEHMLVSGPASPEMREAEKESEKRTRQWMEEDLVNGEYPRNSLGETYGRDFFGELGESPDLIAAVSPEEGLEGYIARDESEYTLGLSPELRRAFENWCQENKVKGYTLPLYDSEHNRIGTFHGVGDGNAPPSFRQITWEELKAAEAQGFPNSKGSAPFTRELPFKTMEEAAKANAEGWHWPEPEE